MINPALVFEAGRMTVRTVKTAGSAVIAGGTVAHNWLKEKMPLEDPSQAPRGAIDFPPLSVPVSENTGYKIKLLENTAKALGTPESASLVKSIINQLNDESFKVLIVGRCNTGKSTLLNKLLDRPLLKIGNGEITKTLAWLMYGEKDEEAAWYHDFQDDLHNITLDEVAKIPDEPPVFNMFACINADILRHGAILIDTPGLEKSRETAELTNEAVENADAVILVVDHYPTVSSDINFIEKLKLEGKAEKLFVVVNKLDNAEAEEIPGIIKKRINVFSELGVRTNIFPMSCKDDTIVPGGFGKFRSALVDYIDNGLQGAREGSVEHQIKNTASHFIKLCTEAAELTKKPTAAPNLKRLEEIEKDTARVIRNNQREIHRLEQDVLGRWAERENKFKDDVNIAIQNATDDQLDRPGQLLTNVQKDINSFLLNEFQSAEDQVLNSITHELDSIDTSTLPIVQQEGAMNIGVLTRWDKSFKNLPPEMGSLGLLAYTFFTRAHGLFSTIACLPNLYLIFVLSPFINKIFEQLIKTGGGVASSIFKTQLQKKINEQWFTIDENVCSKIKEYFDKLSGQMEHLGNDTARTLARNERDKIETAKKSVDGTQFESYGQQLAVIAESKE